MPLSPDTWEEIAALPEGDLGEVPYPVLLASLGRAGRSGLLELVRRPVEKRIVLVDGAPVDCRSNLVHETFGRFLVAAGRLPEEDLAGLMADSLRQEVPLGEVLLERRLLEAADLYRLLQQCLGRKLLDPFTWRAGHFRLLPPSEAEIDATLKVRMPQLILTGVAKLTPLAEVNAAIQPLLTEPIARVPEPPTDTGDLVLRGVPEKIVAALAAGPRRVDELARQTAAGGDELGRALYALSLLGLIAPASRAAPARPAAATSAAPARPQPAPAAPSAGAPSPAVGDAARQRILAAFLSFRRKDAFELLDLPPEAGREAIEQAWLGRARDFAPWTPGVAGDAELADKARALFLAGSLAYAELADNERRGALLHRRRMQEDERRRQASEPRIETDLLDPAVQYRRGSELLAQGDRRRALEYLQYAADLDAQNALYRAEAAWCRYELDPEGSRQQVLEELRDAVRVDPRCGIAWYSLGRVEGDAGLLGDAEEHLRRAIKLMAPDRRPIEALKALTARKR